MKKIYFFLLLLSAAAQAQIISFTDINFKNALLSASPSNGIATDASNTFIQIDSDNDGQIQISEALNVASLQLIQIQNPISNISGIVHFANLKQVSIQHTTAATLDFSNLIHLEQLTCAINYSLTSLLISNCPALKILDVNYCTALPTIDLTVSGSQANLIHLGLMNSGITNIEIFNFVNLNLLDLSACPISQLQMSGSKAANFSAMNLPSLTSIDLSQTRCYSFTCQTMPNLQTVNLKNGITTYSYFQNSSIGYVCADPTDVFQGTVDPNTVINSYCSFTPGGPFFTAEGNVLFDLNGNGCDAFDEAFPNIRFDITDGINAGMITANNSGHYQIPVQAATHTITPDLENPSYFDILPSSVTVSFPADANPSINDFCVTANGLHTDIEIALVPMDRARPGFDSAYKLIYKSKGTVAASGIVSFEYGSNVEFVSANPDISSSGTLLLTWSYADLQPFEQREIMVIMNVNSPTETPAVNHGDSLHYSATGNTDIADELPADNSALLNQPVFNSFDPNDKTCLEGNSIGPEMAGKYVHYQIRFENTGTANAQNIVVKDEIDATKFDITTLVPLDASHSFYTRTDGNKVEFIFENIELPFDDANNDGYVMFKIKTKPNLQVGDFFSNAASIYFDYNHPIMTEPAVTTIELLGTQDFDFASEFALYPNPANDVLHIQSKSGVIVNNIEVYNTLGQIILATTGEALTKIDVSALHSGHYFVKLTTSKGTATSRFVKP